MGRTLDISLDKKYNIPNEIVCVTVGNDTLVIAPQTAKWLVLKSKSQHSFIELLKHQPLGDAITEFKGDSSDVLYVLKQIELSGFESSDVVSCVSDGEKYLQFYLTNDCNLRCPHCYMFAGKKLEYELSTEEIYTAQSDYSSIGGRRVTFTGGEATLRRDFLSILQYANSLGLSCALDGANDKERCAIDRCSSS